MAAGVGTSICWTASTLLFSTAGRRLGATAVNAARIWLALVCVVIAYRAVAGQWIPAARTEQFAWLAVSGFFGVCIGDQALLVAYNLIGPRLSSLVTTAAPIMAALCGIGLLGESITPVSWLGMALTVAGIVWVVAERSPKSATPPRHVALGVMLALVSAGCQAVGLLMSKKGIGHGWLPKSEHISPLAASAIRIAAASVCVAPIVLARVLRRSARAAPPPGAVSVRQAWTCSVFGAVVGPFAGMTLSLYSADRVPIGIAQTLCSLSPIFILPAVAMIFRERVSLRAAAGAIVAVAGGALLFLGR